MNVLPPSRPPLDRGLLEELAPAWAAVEVLAEAPSTNAVVASRARDGAAEGLVVVAEHQTAGRGRLDRDWVTPPRSALTLSVLLRPQVPDARWPWLPLLAGVAVAEAVEAAGGPACRLKWPNDVTYDGRKLAGILVERVDGPAAVLGIGLNVSTTPDELPVPTATSIAAAGWPGTDRTRLLATLLETLGGRLQRWTGDGGDPTRGLLEDYRGRCETVGRSVRVHLPAGEELVGTAVGVAEDGGLVVDGGSGHVTVSAGDVVHVRPA